MEFFAEKLLIVTKKKEHLDELKNELENNNHNSIDKLVNLHIMIAKFPTNYLFVVEKILENMIGTN